MGILSFGTVFADDRIRNGIFRNIDKQVIQYRQKHYKRKVLNYKESNYKETKDWIFDYSSDYEEDIQ